MQIADKSTLDATKSLMENSEYGLKAIKNHITSSSGGSSNGGLQIETIIDEQVNGCVNVSTLPYGFYRGSAVVYNDEIHILGSDYYNSNGSTTDEQYPYRKYHYKFGGSLWKQTYTLPYSFYKGSAIVYNNELHILGTSSGSGSNHYSIKNDYHYITTMLTKGIHIPLSNNENIIYTNNATKIASNIAKVTETGTVEIIAEFPDSDNTQPFLTFY